MYVRAAAQGEAEPPAVVWGEAEAPLPLPPLDPPQVAYNSKMPNS